MQHIDFENVCINCLLIVQWNNADAVIACVFKTIVAAAGVINTWNIMMARWFKAEFCPLAAESNTGLALPPLVGVQQQTEQSGGPEQSSLQGLFHVPPPKCPPCRVSFLMEGMCGKVNMGLNMLTWVQEEIIIMTVNYSMTWAFIRQLCKKKKIDH